MHVSDRMKTLGTETAFLVLAKAKALEAKGRKIVHLEIGEPDFDTPGNIKEAAKRGLDAGYTHYGPAPGLPQARKAIAEYSTRLGHHARGKTGHVLFDHGLREPGGRGHLSEPGISHL